MLQPSWQVLWAEGIQIYMHMLFDPANAPLEICPLQMLTEVHTPQGAQVRGAWGSDQGNSPRLCGAWNVLSRPGLRAQRHKCLRDEETVF